MIGLNIKYFIKNNKNEILAIIGVLAVAVTFTCVFITLFVAQERTPEPIENRTINHLKYDKGDRDIDFNKFIFTESYIDASRSKAVYLYTSIFTKYGTNTSICINTTNPKIKVFTSYVSGHTGISIPGNLNEYVNNHCITISRGGYFARWAFIFKFEENYEIKHSDKAIIRFKSEPEQYIIRMKDLYDQGNSNVKYIEIVNDS